MIFDTYKQRKLSTSDTLEPSGGVAAYIPKTASKKIDFVDVSLKFPGSSKSQIDLQYEESDIKHVIDNDENTYYIPIILSEIEVEDGATEIITIEFDADSFVSSVVIDPIGDNPFFVTKIEYDDRHMPTPTFNQSVTLLDSGVLTKRIESSTIIDFDKVKATHIHITVLQDTYSLVNVNTEQNKVIQVSEFDPVDTKAGQVQPDVAQIFTTASTSNATSLPYYKYQYGIADMHVSNNIFKDDGFHISKEHVIDNCLTLSVEDDVTTTVTANVYDYQVEHRISLSIDTEGSDTLGFILPLATVGSDTFVERLSVNELKRARLSFPVDSTDEIDEVYVDGTPTSYTLDSTLEFEEHPLISITGPVSPRSIVTIEYSPSFITNPQKKYKINKSGDVSFDINNTGIVGIDENFVVTFYKPTDQVRVRHRVLMRANQGTVTRLNDAKLVYSLRNANKYRGI